MDFAIGSSSCVKVMLIRVIGWKGQWNVMAYWSCNNFRYWRIFTFFRYIFGNIRYISFDITSFDVNALAGFPPDIRDARNAFSRCILHFFVVRGTFSSPSPALRARVTGVRSAEWKRTNITHGVCNTFCPLSAAVGLSVLHAPVPPSSVVVVDRYSVGGSPRRKESKSEVQEPVECRLCKWLCRRRRRVAAAYRWHTRWPYDLIGPIRPARIRFLFRYSPPLSCSPPIPNRIDQIRGNDSLCWKVISADIFSRSSFVILKKSDMYIYIYS